MGPPLHHVPRPEARAALLSLIAGVSLCAIKFVAYFLTGSAAIFSDALESVVNVVAAAFAVYALSLAHRPADAEHPYGHGKAEFLSSAFEGGMILLAALVIVFRSIESLLRGPQIQRLEHGLLLVALAMLINGMLGLWLIRRGRRHGSATLQASGKHLMTDALTSVGVLLALLLVKLTGWAYIDPLAALLIAAYIILVAGNLLRSSAAGLMDEQDRADERRLRQILDAHAAPDGREPKICSYHKLRHRHSGRYHWVDFHIMLPASWNIDQGHQVASAIEYEIEQALGEGNATAHVEPCVDEDCPACR